MDDQVVRDRDADANPATGGYGQTGSGREERVYAQRDANHNVTALADVSGAVVQRFAYDPYGASTVLDASGTVATDGYDWAYRHQGGRLEAATGLYSFRRRDYDPATGRWAEADPAMYVDGANYYEAYGSTPVSVVDPSGKWIWVAVGAAIGGIAGGLASGTWQGAVGGAIGGAVAAATFNPALAAAASGGWGTGVAAGAVAGAASGAIGGGTGSVAEQLLKNRRISPTEVVRNSAGGAAGGALVGGAGRAAEKALKFCFKPITVKPSYPRNGPKRAPSAGPEVPWSTGTKSFYHKGAMEGGVPSPHKPLSTGVDKQSVAALGRNSDKIWEFKIPCDKFNEWKYAGKVKPRHDLDNATGIHNEEWQFEPELADELIKYLVQ